jgi:hypothetical protein
MNGNKRCFTCKRRMVYDYHKKLYVAPGEQAYLWEADPKGTAFLSIEGKRQMGFWKKLQPRMHPKPDGRVRYTEENESKRGWGWR